MKDRVLGDKSFSFAVRIVKLAMLLRKERQEYVLSKQLLRSGTAIGALVREAFYGESRADMAHKYAIALKEAHETIYWLELLTATSHLSERESASILPEATELLKILTSTVKSLKTPPTE